MQNRKDHGCYWLHKCRLKYSAGFSLAELMLVLVIIALLASVAFPSYGVYRNRSIRKVALSVLLECAMAAEKQAGATFSYAGLDANTDQNPDLADCPSEVRYAGAPVYQIKVISASQYDYRLQAMPLVGTPVEGTGRLEIDQGGRKYWDQNNDGQFEGENENSWVVSH